MSEIKALARVLARNWTSTAAAVFMLGAAIAAAVTTFAAADAALWQDLPYRDPQNLAVLWTKHSNGRDNVSMPDFVSVRTNGTAFSTAAAGSFTSDYALTGFGDPRQVRARVLSADYFRTLGVPLIGGRDFNRDEEKPGAGYVAILTDHLWQQLFNRQPALGTALALNGRTYTIVGILPPYRDPQGQVDIYVPHQFAPTLPRNLRLMTPIVRFAPTSSIALVRAEVRRLTEAPDDPEAKGYAVEVMSLAERLARQTRSSVSLLFGAGIGLLAIALLNFSTLMAARARQRRAEFSIRIAIGATFRKIAGLAVAESVVLSCAGAVLALGLSYLVLPVLQSHYAKDIVNEIGIGIRVVVFTVLTAVMAILASAITATRVMKGQGVSTRHVALSRFKAGRTLLVMQIGISMALVVSSVVLAGSFFKLQKVDPGFRTDGLYASRIALPAGRYTDAAKRTAFWRAVIQQLSDRGVKAALTSNLPLTGGGDPIPFTIRMTDGTKVTTKLRVVSPQYFDLIRIPLREGRNLAITDRENAPQVIVVNERLAAYLSRLGPAVGQTISTDVADPPIVGQVVGIIGDIRDDRLSASPEPEAYYIFDQTPNVLAYSVVLESAATPADVSALLRTTLNAIDRQQPFTPPVRMSDYLYRSLGEARLQAQLFLFFAVVAVIVALSGVYSLVTFLVAGTRRESAIRLALGATAGRLQKAILRESAAYAAAGVGVGLGILVLSGALLRPLLYGVSLWNPILVLGCAVGLAGACVLVATIPAMRLGHVSPVEVLLE
jgi:putative ABC transport system permease protein